MIYCLKQVFTANILLPVSLNHNYCDFIGSVVSRLTLDKPLKRCSPLWPAEGAVAPSSGNASHHSWKLSPLLCPLSCPLSPHFLHLQPNWSKSLQWLFLTDNSKFQKSKTSDLKVNSLQIATGGTVGFWRTQFQKVCQKGISLFTSKFQANKLQAPRDSAASLALIISPAVDLFHSRDRLIDWMGEVTIKVTGK